MQIDDHRACQELHDHLYEVIDFLDREGCQEHITTDCLKDPALRAQLLEHISRCSHCQESMHTERYVRSLLAHCLDEPAPASLRARIVSKTCVTVSWSSTES